MNKARLSLVGLLNKYTRYNQNANTTRGMDMKYIVLVTRSDGSQAAYGPMTMQQAKTFVASIGTNVTTKIFYLTQG